LLRGVLEWHITFATLTGLGTRGIRVDIRLLLNIYWLHVVLLNLLSVIHLFGKLFLRLSLGALEEFSVVPGALL
jgi:hypothetical protein